MDFANPNPLKPKTMQQIQAATIEFNGETTILAAANETNLNRQIAHLLLRKLEGKERKRFLDNLSKKGDIAHALSVYAMQHPWPEFQLLYSAVNLDDEPALVHNQEDDYTLVRPIWLTVGEYSLRISATGTDDYPTVEMYELGQEDGDPCAVLLEI